MAKRLKLRIARILQSCRSKHPSSLPSNPVPSFLRLAPTTKPNLASPAPPQTKPRRSSLRRHVASALTCGFGSRRYVDDLPPKFEWEQEDKFWHVVAANDTDTPRRKIYNSSASDRDDVVSALPPRKKKRRARKKKATARASMSTSSADSGALFSDDGVFGEGTETLVCSSRSFSTDSEFSPRLKPIREAPPRRRRTKRCILRTAAGESDSAPARLSVFQRLLACSVEGKVRDSFAVVKRSEDPYEDFKKSMTEMIVEKRMVDEKDLEQLLRCFLSLNSRDHHGVIVQAFAEIWEAMFNSSRRSSSRPVQF